jgi:hypothetical protein
MRNQHGKNIKQTKAKYTTIIRLLKKVNGKNLTISFKNQSLKNLNKTQQLMNK